MAKIGINVPYLTEIIKQSKMTGRDFGNTIGQGGNWAKNVLYRGEAKDYAIDMICRMYGADRAKLTTPVPKEEKQKETAPITIDDKSLEVLVNALVRIEKKLDRLMARHGL